LIQGRAVNINAEGDFLQHQIIVILFLEHKWDIN
jgi:hypothetical protein